VVGAAASYHTTYLVGAGVAVLGAVCALFVRSTPRVVAALGSVRGTGAPEGARSDVLDLLDVRQETAV
jgi:hypothetical protein